ncbi:hypothetical protein GCM10023085_34860 [Actinomadura viridis]
MNPELHITTKAPPSRTSVRRPRGGAPEAADEPGEAADAWTGEAGEVDETDTAVGTTLHIGIHTGIATRISIPVCILAV